MTSFARQSAATAPGYGKVVVHLPGFLLSPLLRLLP